MLKKQTIWYWRASLKTAFDIVSTHISYSIRYNMNTATHTKNQCDNYHITDPAHVPKCPCFGDDDANDAIPQCVTNALRWRTGPSHNSEGVGGIQIAF